MAGEAVHGVGGAARMEKVAQANVPVLAVMGVRSAQESSSTPRRSSARIKERELLSASALKLKTIRGNWNAARPRLTLRKSQFSSFYCEGPRVTLIRKAPCGLAV